MLRGGKNFVVVDVGCFGGFLLCGDDF